MFAVCTCFVAAFREKGYKSGKVRTKIRGNVSPVRTFDEINLPDTFSEKKQVQTGFKKRFSGPYL